MKKMFLLLIGLWIFTSKLLAASMGDYIDLVHNIDQLQQPSNHEIRKNELIHFSKILIKASDQTMAETIMLMIVASEHNKKPIVCVPHNFYLDASSVEDLIMQGYDKSEVSEQEKRSMPAATFAIATLIAKYPC